MFMHLPVRLRFLLIQILEKFALKALPKFYIFLEQ